MHKAKTSLLIALGLAVGGALPSTPSRGRATRSVSVVLTGELTEASWPAQVIFLPPQLKMPPSDIGFAPVGELGFVVHDRKFTLEKMSISAGEVEVRTADCRSGTVRLSSKTKSVKIAMGDPPTFPFKGIRMAMCGLHAKGGLIPEVVTRIVRRHGNEIAYCMDKFRQSDETVRRFHTSWTIDTEGFVAETAGPDADAIDKCIDVRVKRWRFPGARIPTEIQMAWLLRVPVTE